jgi:chromosome segregation ATPase
LVFSPKKWLPNVFSGWAEVDSAWRAGINKKISELTKIVFRLHSDSMDHQNSLVELKDRYEDEIGLILGQLKAHLAAAQGEADGFHNVIQDVVRREFETKFEQTRREFEAAKVKVEADVDQSVAEAESLLAGLRSQLAQLREKADCDIAEFKSSTAEIQDVHKRAIQRMEATRKKELVAILKRANKKYERTVRQSQQKEEELRQKHESEIADLRKLLEESKVSAEAPLAKRKQEIENSIQQLTLDKENVIKCLKELAELSAAHQSEIQATLHKAEQLKEQILEGQQRELVVLQ